MKVKKPVKAQWFKLDAETWALHVDPRNHAHVWKDNDGWRWGEWVCDSSGTATPLRAAKADAEAAVLASAKTIVKALLARKAGAR